LTLRDSLEVNAMTSTRKTGLDHDGTREADHPSGNRQSLGMIVRRCQLNQGARTRLHSPEGGAPHPTPRLWTRAGPLYVK